MAEMSEARLEQLLRAALHAEAATLPMNVHAETLARRAETRRRATTRRRAAASRALRLLALAAMLPLPLGLLLGVALQPDDDDDRAEEHGYGAVIVRGLAQAADGSGITDLEVVVAVADGTAHGLLRIPASRFPPGIVLSYSPLVSATGWLVFGVGVLDEVEEGMFMVDLKRPDREPIVVEPMASDGISSAGWGPDGVLWRPEADGIEWLDPESGAWAGRSGVIPDGLELVSAGAALSISADGSGPVVGPGGQAWVDSGGRPAPTSWGTITRDGDLVPGIPAIAPGIGARTLSDRWGLLEVCDPQRQRAGICSDKERGTVASRPDADGSERTWGEPPAPHEFVMEASWAAHGGVWRLVDRRDRGRTIALVHRDEAGVDTVGPTVAAPGDGTIYLSALAPDDSLIAMDWLEGDEWSTALADTTSDRTHRHVGRVAGFVDPEVARAWALGEFAGQPGEPMAAATAPGADPAYPPLMPLDEQTAHHGRVLLAHEEPATVAPDGTPSPPTTVTLGPVELGTGVGMSLVCSGPGDVSYVAHWEGPDDAPVVKHCQDRWADDWSAPFVEEPSVTVTVTSDPDTTWRLVIHDPPDRDPRSPRDGGRSP